MMRMTPPPAATPIIKPVLVFFELLDGVFTVDGAGVDTLPADGEGDGEDCGGGDSITGLLGDTRLEGARAGGVDGGAGDVGGDETGAGVGLGGGTGGGLFGGGGGGGEEEENGGEDGDTTGGDGDNAGGGVGNEDGEAGLFVGLVGGGVAGGGEF